MLAPYALRPEETRGRRYPEARHPYRNDFQRDRDRVIHSRAFRRLENKTQVFTRRYSDHFRNRLTHTIEVAQISRTIAAELGLNDDLVETLALVHDIGHPPFGHSGEHALNAAMHEHGDSFDHNLHALRTVEQFEQRYADFPGLNLTFEVREGIIKHSCDYDPQVFPHLSEYLLDQRPPLEAQLIDFTDEIAYNTADLDDGLESRIITVRQVRTGLPVFALLYDEAEHRYPKAPDKLKFNETLKRLVDRLVSDLIDNTRKALAATYLDSVEAVRRHPNRVVAFSPEIEKERQQIKAFLYENVYFSAPLKADKKKAERLIAEVFAFFIKSPEKLPASYQEKMLHEPLHRVVCDYIAGMTDNYAQEQHRAFCSERKKAVSSPQ
ncbi:MAG: deoxyguanosinetriphosphate triphosphohydrolase [Candidatus Angelobacter sp. Gp1-AA117]|nr:MAG: deoxyguanosinetriphosphate triphosphohydrolase [Candidatus Angelobacter sp. Gp1-AA117]